ncbi:MAG: polyprenol monophosphomannose synthase [Endomicrobiales bacterium]|nr:polyprenol monophosphomannose synthase [Endomicrobiales bacterium]
MRVVAVIPTYNESGNIEGVINEILRLPLNIEALVVDDLSPDGTYKIVEKLSKENNRVHLLLRKEGRGRGWAGIDGFKKALEMNADFIVEMDGDFSHHPKFIQDFFIKVQEADIVIGSRYIKGGKDVERGLLRKLISFFARKYLSLILGLRVTDPTSGFRMFKKSAVEKIVERLHARDPFIVTEVLFYARKHGLKIVEVPIEFMQRAAGESKLKAGTLIKYLIRVWKLKFGK